VAPTMEPRARTRRRPGIPDRDWFLGRGARRGQEAFHHSAGYLPKTCHGTGAVGTPQTCTVCGGNGHNPAVRGQDEIQRAVHRAAAARATLRTVCKTCSGEGRVRRSKRLKSRIPAGVANGGRVRVPGKGNAGRWAHHRVTCICEWLLSRMNSSNGAATIVYEDSGHRGARPRWARRLSADDRWAALVRIPPGTNSGKTLRLKEKGVPSARNGARGDQYVEIQVVVPPPTDDACEI